MSTPPLPPAELARRVGVIDQDHPVASFDEMGAAIKGPTTAMRCPISCASSPISCA